MPDTTIIAVIAPQSVVKRHRKLKQERFQSLILTRPLSVTTFQEVWKRKCRQHPILKNCTCFKFQSYFYPAGIVLIQFSSHDWLLDTRSLEALWALTSSWKPFGHLDFVLRTLRALKPCDPRNIDWIVCQPLYSVLAIGQCVSLLIV